MPKLLPPEIKAEMLNRIRKGHSLNDISRGLSIAKSTIYHHYRRINGKRYHEPSIDVSYSELEGEVAGIFAGDGSLHFEPKRYHYETNVHFGRRDYLDYVKTLFECYFSKKFRVQEESLGRARLKTHSKKIYSHFWNYLDFDRTRKHDTVRLKSLDFPECFNVGFLRGFMDTDGTICRTGAQRYLQIVYYTTSAQLAQQIKTLLGKFNIEANVFVRSPKRAWEKPCYHVYLLASGKQRFVNLIKPFKAKKLGLVV